jgi:hypothetical protein
VALRKRFAAVSFAFLLAIMVTTQANTACPIVKIFEFTNNSGAGQTQLWIDLDDIAPFNQANSTAGWTCTGVSDVFDDQYNCAGPNVPNGGKVKVAFRNPPGGVPVNMTHSGWGPRDGNDDDGTPNTSEVCSVGGISESPDVRTLDDKTGGGGWHEPGLLTAVLVAAMLSAGGLVVRSRLRVRR